MVLANSTMAKELKIKILFNFQPGKFTKKGFGITTPNPCCYYTMKLLLYTSVISVSQQLISVACQAANLIVLSGESRKIAL